MQTNDILQESQTTAWNRVLLLLNKVFGFKSGGTVRRIGQKFDQRKGEHVILLEYRVKSQNQSPIVKQSEKVKLVPDDKD